MYKGDSQKPIIFSEYEYRKQFRRTTFAIKGGSIAVFKI